MVGNEDTAAPDSSRTWKILSPIRLTGKGKCTTRQGKAAACATKSEGDHVGKVMRKLRYGSKRPLRTTKLGSSTD